MISTPKYHILIPVHNRKEVTLACLHQLQILMNDENWKICVIDDGSTDGTAKAVTTEFPCVKLLLGDGNLFWTGAMELGMRHAVLQNSACIVWMNDDLTTEIDVIRALIELATTTQAIVAAEGVVQHKDRPPFYFPGFYRTFHKLDTRDLPLESREPVEVDSCRGNLVAIPASVVTKIGYPDGRNIPHFWGDADYTLRASAAGISCVTLMTAIFHEKEIIRTDNRSWLLDDRSPMQIWRNSTSRRGIYYPRAYLIYQFRHWGLIGIWNFVNAYLKLIMIFLIKLLVPGSMLIKLYAKRSAAFQNHEKFSKSGA